MSDEKTADINRQQMLGIVSVITRLVDDVVCTDGEVRELQETTSAQQSSISEIKQDVKELRAQSKTKPTVKSCLFEVGELQNRCFTGRIEKLGKLEITIANKQFVSVTGVPGIGKSSLVLEYV